jgi:hypothetical protein
MAGLSASGYVWFQPPSRAIRRKFRAEEPGSGSPKCHPQSLPAVKVNKAFPLLLMVNLGLALVARLRFGVLAGGARR